MADRYPWRKVSYYVPLTCCRASNGAGYRDTGVVARWRMLSTKAMVPTDMGNAWLSCRCNRHHAVHPSSNTRTTSAIGA